MKQVLTFLALLAIYFMSISAHSSRVIAPRTGYTAPTLELTKGGEEIATNDFNGEYLLLTFWSSTDAQSRVRCNSYEGLTSSRNAKLNRLAVNLDRSERLYDELVRYDHLDPQRQFHLDAEAAKSVIEQFGMQKGLKSFLIDPSGRIIAVNPTLEEIPA